MRILLIGANSMLGKDLLELWTADQIIPATSRDADIREIDQVRRIVHRAQPDWVVSTAAYTDVDGAEADPATAFAVNRDGAKNVAIAARETNTKMLFASTDYVFDGNSSRPYEISDPVHPLNVYGLSKAAGEAAVQEHANHWLIARTSWLFGAAKACFPEKILRAAASQSPLRVVNDQIGSPTYTKDLAVALHELLEKNAQGILHVSNTGSCSWFEFAQYALQETYPQVVVNPIETSDSRRPATRPAYSVLSSAALAAYGIVLRHWKEAVDAYLCELRSKGKLRQS